MSITLDVNLGVLDSYIIKGKVIINARVHLVQPPLVLLSFLGSAERLIVDNLISHHSVAVILATSHTHHWDVSL